MGVMRSVVVLVSFFVALCCCSSLRSYNVPIANTTVSGLSSGGYFAVQMHFAYSSIIHGVGVFAGGPYHCAKGDLSEALGPCMKAQPAGPDVSSLIYLTDSRSVTGEIEDVANLKSHRVFMFSGMNDVTIRQPVMDSLYEFYTNYVKPENIYYEYTTNAAHTQPTNNRTANPCPESSTPYISYCSFDGAGESLTQLYGPLNSPNQGTPTGTLFSFDQSEFLKNPKEYSVADTGYVYVPNSCQRNNTCILHVALHGCLQAYEAVGFDYISGSGYNKWADTNNLIILYPQARASQFNPQNPNGCWNWWGYNNNPLSYDTKKGHQMNMIYLMIHRIASGFISVESPQGLRVVNTTESSVSLAWNSVSEANGYHVLRDHQQITAKPLQRTSYTDDSVLSGTYYKYQIVSVSENSQSVPSESVDAKTTGPSPVVSAPANLTVVGSTSTSITLAWSPVNGAYSYNLYRDGNVVNNGFQIMGTTYVDSGLTPSTNYTYQVTALNADLVSSEPSQSVVGRTTSDFVCTTVKDSNYKHVAAGRAYQKFGEAFAVGSGEYIGLYSTLVYTQLAQIYPNYWILGNCDRPQ